MAFSGNFQQRSIIGLRLRHWLAAVILVTLLPVVQAQQDAPASQAGTRCEIPDVSFWSPPESESSFVVVDVEFFVLDIIEINDRLNRFKLDFTLTLRWTDHRLESVATGDAGCTTLLAEIWHPQFIFVNSGEGAGDYDGLVEVLRGGEVTYSKRFTREFAANLDLRRFPYDAQELVVDIASMLYGPDDVRFAASAAGTEILAGARIPGWKVSQLESSVPEQPIITKTSSHSSLSYAVHVERESGYYFWRLVFPLMMITLMAWSVFWLEPSQLGPQMTVATGAIFSLMAFLVSQGQILPAVSYISIADRLIVACVVLVFTAFGEAVLTGTLSQAGHDKLAKTIDRFGRWVYLSAVVLLIVVLV